MKNILLLIGCQPQMKMSRHATNENVPFMPRKLVDNEAMIPEEFPVVLTVFLSMGAWRLAKKSSLVRRLPSVETLGAVSVLCVDKTGTITENRMKVQKLWALNGDERGLIEIMGLGCEPDAYDPMETAMLDCCSS